jgi:hypothetical protein
VSSKVYSKNVLSEQCCILIKVGFIEFRPTDALSLLNSHLNLKESMPTRNSVMKFLFESILQEVSEQQLTSCTLMYSFGKQKENKLGQQILYFSL